jgi:hypothetical protein
MMVIDLLWQTVRVSEKIGKRIVTWAGDSTFGYMNGKEGHEEVFVHSCSFDYYS